MRIYNVLILLLAACNFAKAQNCVIPEVLQNEIEMATVSGDFKEKDFYKINEMLFEYEFKDSLSTLKNCTCYSKNIIPLFNSQDDEKRLLAYRLIGIAQDSTFNDKLIDKIKSNENALLKTWSSTALMANKSSAASDDLFKLFSSFPKGLPVDILIQMYIQYDTLAVKNSCWKYINSENRNEQIISIQCLASLGKSETLQKQLRQFLESWDTASKGWVIASMGIQKMADLKPLLKKYSKSDDLRGVVIRALENSPTKTDNEFAKQLEK